MGNGILGTKVVTQIGIIVKDIDKTSEAFADFLGVDKPQWRLTDGHDVARTRLRGEATDARAKLAFFHVGSVDIELIEPVGGPSTWKEFLDEHGEGVHHIAFIVKDMHQKIQDLEQIRIPLIQSGEYVGGRYAYMDASESLKVIIELLENDV
ncbi:VOC family protein [Alicyclobacillus shizuokensis]|uniref:VOC family protein n=1 Tax=Alicyclobacillus shizuokensis TaxID=392014 RepID=UPI00082BB0E7|nr:VOC family protein [Alicyclobacillus shizuokensis]MCL6625290.1 VOC family protein [Alicyclobacillus shizuokensis]